MGSFFKKVKEKLFATLSVEIAGIWPSSYNINKMRRLNKIQLSTEQMKLMSETIKKKTPCKLLVFGLGNDSLFWMRLNRRGKTIFLEDNEYWLKLVTKRIKGLEALLVSYNTIRKDWKNLLETPSLLNSTLLNELGKEGWDIILVDAPAGFDDLQPGRMKSIYMSSKLIKNSGDIFIHDCDREVEDIYSNHFLKKENLQMEVRGSNGIGSLRHYQIKDIL